MLRRGLLASILAIFVPMTSCGGGGSGSGQVSPPAAAASITATSGTPQSTIAGTSFGAPLVATVLDNRGNPVNGAVVTFTPPVASASARFTNGINTATTNESGVAVSGTLVASGTAGGPYTVTATVAGAATQADFSLTNTAGPAAQIGDKSGNPQTTTVNTAFTVPLAVEVTDINENPVQGVVVTFSAPATGASGTFAGGVNTATTNASGIATAATFTANEVAGAYTVTASATGVTPPVNFSLTNAAGPAAGVTATGGSGQSAAIDTTFIAPLGVQIVDSFGNPVSDSGVLVTFSAPPGGASASFSNGVTTATTDANGQATSAVVTANGTAGGPYTVTATGAGLGTPAEFNLTNVAPGPANYYSFYLNGLESARYGTNSYGLAGSVEIDASGYVLAGEQDYKDDWKAASPQPSGDSITGGVLSASAATGQGTLTLVTNDTVLGVNGIETFGVQFANKSHAIIIQFDGSATSSGSMDLQTLPSVLNGSFSFTILGTDPDGSTISAGGVFTVSGTNLLSGLCDFDDTGSGTSAATLIIGGTFTGTISAPDSFGRGSIAVTDANLPAAVNYYVVGPEVIRLVVVGDAYSSGIGSAFGQGASAGNFSNQSLGNSVFGVESNSNIESEMYAAAGMFTTSPGSGTFQGVADDDEEGAVTSDSSISGSYTIANNGYGSLTIEPSQLGRVSVLGIYMTDPNLNLIDPNNTTSGLGGALVADLDSVVNGTGVLIPQTDTSAASFAGNYAFGARTLNATGQAGWEVDFVGQGTVANAVLSGTGLVSDPSTYFLGDNIVNSGVPFSANISPDMSFAGRYTLGANGLKLKIGGPENDGFTPVVIYQANGEQMMWIEEGSLSLFLGSLQQQGSLAGLPGAH